MKDSECIQQAFLRHSVFFIRIFHLDRPDAIVNLRHQLFARTFGFSFQVADFNSSPWIKSGDLVGQLD